VYWEGLFPKGRGIVTGSDFVESVIQSFEFLFAAHS
jgi:hypothetical protein